MSESRADPTQAWYAAAVPFMVSELLGLQVDGFVKAVTARRPMLPDGADRLDLHDVQVGEAAVALRFTRNRTGSFLAALANPGGVTVKALP